MAASCGDNVTCLSEIVAQQQAELDAVLSGLGQLCASPSAGIGSVAAAAKCPSEAMEDQDTATTRLFLFTSAAAIVFMQGGFSMLEVGVVRDKHARTIMFKNMIDFCLGVVIWCAFGFALSTIASSDPGEFGDVTWANGATIIHSLGFATTASTILSGAVAERMTVSAYMILALVTTGITYSFAAAWVWGDNSPAFEAGFLDFAGGTAVHVVGGVAGLVGTIALGARAGRFELTSRSVRVHEFPANSNELANLGVWILFFGWLFFNGSSVAAGDAESMETALRAVGNTILCPSVAAIVTCGLMMRELGRHELSSLHNAFLGGTVMITSTCGYVDAYVSLVYGVISALVSWYTPLLLISRQIDDPLDAFVVHGANGLVGTVLLGFFAKPEYIPGGSGDSHPAGLFYDWESNGKLLGVQLGTSLLVAAWAAAVTALVFGFMYLVKLQTRIEETAEALGLDAKYADGYAMKRQLSSSIVQEHNVRRAAQKKVNLLGRSKKTRSATAVVPSSTVYDSASATRSAAATTTDSAPPDVVSPSVMSQSAPHLTSTPGSDGSPTYSSPILWSNPRRVNSDSKAAEEEDKREIENGDEKQHRISSPQQRDDELRAAQAQAAEVL